jgi:hypothetical protein
MESEGTPAPGLARGRERWEYRVSVIGVGGFFRPALNGDALTSYLNEAGGDGWELVGLVDINRLQGGTAGLLISLKRRK